MEVLNLAASALFESVSKNNFDQRQLIAGTQLKLEDILKTKKTHSWDEFVKMYENCAHLLGPSKAVREIAHCGLFNENLSILRKTATGFFDSKTIYWYFATFAAKHLFKDTVSFKYTKIKSNQIVMEITINPELRDCRLLLETYIYLFENVPTLLGLPKAVVNAEIHDHRAIYNVYLARSSYFSHLLTRISGYINGYKSSIVLLGEMEDQSIQLANLVEEKSQLLRILSHDISNQVFIIESYLQKVLKNQQLSVEDKKYLQISYNSSKKLETILKNVRNLEKSHINGVDLSPVNLDSVFEAVANHFKERLENKNITLKCQNNLPPNITALAEKTSLEINVLGNLVSNAIKFSHEGSTIELDASFYDGKVHLRVCDQGIGIPKEERNYLFTKKIRNSSPGTKGEAGTGFGLGIVKNYINFYKGKISTYQNIPCGTIFSIELMATAPQIIEDSLLFNVSSS